MALVFAGLGACASAPEPILIALPAAARGADPARAAAASRPDQPNAGTLLVRRLSIPEYMVARRVRYTSGIARMAEWPDAYWAERIEVGMARELVAALREALPDWRVCDSSCGDGIPDVTLKVELQRLDVLRGEGRIRARAQIQLGLAKPLSSATAPLAATPQVFAQVLPEDTAQGQAWAMTDLLRSIAVVCAAAVSQARESATERRATP
jgi:uncharacterized lipoprotein YmbA